MLFRTMMTLVYAALLLEAAAGCSQETLNSAQKDAAKNTEIVQREANRAERKARPQMNRLKMGARVTAALQANEKLPRSIRVDASDTGVRLRGTVDTAAQKERAGRIARDTLSEDRSVSNELEVR